MTASSTKTGAPFTTLTVPAVRARQDGHTIYMAFVRGDDLKAYTDVDRYDPALPIEHPDQGYQRAAEPPRVKKLGNWFRAMSDSGAPILMPTAILLSSRDADVTYNDDLAQLTISSRRKLQVVDGQHRREGVRYAIEQKGVAQLRDFMLPVIIIEDLTRLDEMKQFALVNGNQKSVRTDLVNMILTRMASEQGDDTIREGDEWRIIVTRVVEMLNAEPGPWQDLVAMPNEVNIAKKERANNPELEHKKIVRATSFMTSLKPLYDFFKATEWDVSDAATAEMADRLHSIVKAFWEAIAVLNPDAIRAPNDYVLQKTPGLFSLHRLCKRLLPLMMQMRRDPTVAEEWVTVLENSADISNPEYWSKTGGGASAFGSMKGFAELGELLWLGLQP